MKKFVESFLEKLWEFAFFRFLRDGISLYFNQRVPQAAACLAYFVLLTVFPVLICVTSFLGVLHIDSAVILQEMSAFLPKVSLNLLESYLNYVAVHQSAGLFIAGLAGCWFSAAAAFRTITRVMSDVYADVPHSSFLGMLTSIVFPIALLLTIDLSIAVVITGQRTLEILSNRFPFLSKMLVLWSWLRFLLLFAVFFLFVLAVLNMAAPRRIPRLPILMSSVFSSLALVLASGLFSWFMGISSRYSLVYGSLVSLIVLLVWLYLCGQILFIGVVFTGLWHQNRQKNTLREG